MIYSAATTAFNAAMTLLKSSLKGFFRSRLPC